jgi:hypothetical protein
VRETLRIVLIVSTPVGRCQSCALTFPFSNKGGEFLLRHEKQELSFRYSVDLLQDAFKDSCEWIAFYTNIEHEIKPVTAGYRVSLVYNLYFGNKKRKKIVVSFHIQMSYFLFFLSSFPPAAEGKIAHPMTKMLSQKDSVARSMEQTFRKVKNLKSLGLVMEQQYAQGIVSPSILKGITQRLNKKKKKKMFVLFVHFDF